MVKYNLYDRKTLLRDGPFSLPGEGLSGQKIVIGYGRWGDSPHFRKGGQLIL